jgi:hypothetical protein
MKHPIDSECRMCYKAEELKKYIVARCTTLVPFECTSRCSKVAGYIHWTVFKHVGLQVTDKFFEHRQICGTTVMWHVPVITD